MANKIIGFLDANAEKILWVIVLILSVAVLFLRVLFSPNQIEYDGKKFSAGSLDQYILNQARNIEVKLDRKPEPSLPYDPCFVSVMKLFDNPIQIAKISVPVPPSIKGRPTPPFIYSLPEIGPVTDVKVNYFRSAAWVPKEEITETNPYNATTPEVNDLDLVTVEAKYDVSGLYNRLSECFAGIDVNQEWRDPCLAKPVFASVGLERQEQLPEGGWSEWTLVPRSRIDQNKRLFDIKDSVDELGEGGVDVKLLLFSSMQVQASLLQPAPYQIASAEESWYPPSIYPEFRKQEDDILENERKQAKEAKLTEKANRDTGDTSGKRGTYGSAAYGPAARGSAGTAATKRNIPGVPGRVTPGTGRADEIYPYSGKTTGRSKPVVDINAEFIKLQLTDSTEYKKLKEPITFWAFDDTVEAGNNYRYRIRLGVFNRVAGTNQLKESFAAQRNHVLLWSDYSNVTDVVSVPKKLYAFPTVAQMSPKAVSIQISKYILGYWYSKRFTVKPGEAIGTKVAYEPEVPADKTATQTDVTNVVTPATIDYSTGAVLLDVMAINDWFSVGDNKLDSRQYFDMLYTYDGINLERDPIQTVYWAKDLASNFNEIKKLEKRDRKEFQPWSGGGQRTPTGLQRRTRNDFGIGPNWRMEED